MKTQMVENWNWDQVWPLSHHAELRAQDFFLSWFRVQGYA